MTPVKEFLKLIKDNIANDADIKLINYGKFLYKNNDLTEKDFEACLFMIANQAYSRGYAARIDDEKSYLKLIEEL